MSAVRPPLPAEAGAGAGVGSGGAAGDRTARLTQRRSSAVEICRVMGGKREVLRISGAFIAQPFDERQELRFILSERARVPRKPAGVLPAPAAGPRPRRRSPGPAAGPERGAKESKKPRRRLEFRISLPIISSRDR